MRYPFGINPELLKVAKAFSDSQPLLDAAEKQRVFGPAREVVELSSNLRKLGGEQTLRMMETMRKL